MSSTDDAEAFFVHYGEAQADSAEAAASLWSLPAMLIELNDVAKVFTDRGELVEALAPAYPIYQRLGLTTIKLADAEMSQVTETVLRTRTRWFFYAGAELLTDPIFDYTLRREDGQLAMCFAIAIDLAEKIGRVTEDQDVSLA